MNGVVLDRWLQRHGALQVVDRGQLVAFEPMSTRALLVFAGPEELEWLLRTYPSGHRCLVEIHEREEAVRLDAVITTVELPAWLLVQPVELPQASGELEAAVSLVARLRSADGCPWDREQTHPSLRRYLLEETYEFIDSVNRGDQVGMREELGDLLLQVLLHSQIAKEDDKFDIHDVVRELIAKMVRRHPHVFSGLAVDSIGQVLDNWHRIKQGELGGDSARQPSALDGVVPSMPSLALATKLLERAERLGLDPKWLVEWVATAERPDQIAEGRLAGELMALAAESHAAGVDAEQTLAAASVRLASLIGAFEEEARRQQAAGRQATEEVKASIWEQMAHRLVDET